jgi:4-amino-4-deoxy-L-arabinose transferase-like glycosyltransferase
VQRLRPRISVRRQQFLLAALILLAFAVRLHSIGAPPLDFAPARQTYGALRARIIYLDARRDVEPWRREVLEDVRPMVPQIEPPVLEHLAAAGYRLLGSEQVWVARLLSVLFWLAGAVFLYRLAHRVSEASGPLIAVSLYLFLPIAIVGSRSFQPDPLMVALMLAALVAVVRFHEHPSRARLGVAAGVSALAVLSKPPFAAFFLVAAFYSLAIANRGTSWLRQGQSSLTFFAFSLAPAALYYLYGIEGGGYLEGHASSSLEPRLLADPEFWRGWLGMVASIVAYPVDGLSGFDRLAIVGVLAVAAAAGLRWTRSRNGRSLLVGLWIGYLVFGAVFTVHISTHVYYSLPLVPIVALSVAPAAAAAVKRLSAAPIVVRGAAVLATLGAASVIAWTVERELGSADYLRQARTYERVGRIVDHANDAVHVDRSFNTPLLYFAWISSSPLYYPGGGQLELRDLRDRIREVSADSGAPRFLIVTATEELARQRALRAIVRQLSVVARTRGYAIYSFPR